VLSSTRKLNLRTIHVSVSAQLQRLKRRPLAQNSLQSLTNARANSMISAVGS
jgi:hypothetical protein